MHILATELAVPCARDVIDEDISIEGLLLGRPSGESQASFSRWLENRKGPAR